MLYKCYLKKGMVYLPTTVNQGIGRYFDVEPVTVVPVADTERLRHAMRETIPKENRFVPPSIEDARKPPVILKYSGDKSWGAFTRGTSRWSIWKESGASQIERYQRIPGEGSFAPDDEQTIKFSPGTKIDDVIDRMIAILQDAARK
jgi:hypothetical protein